MRSQLTGHWARLSLLLLLFLPLTSSWAEPQLYSKGDKDAAYKAQQYKRIMAGYAAVHWKSGEAPLPLLAAQVHQESRWNPLARSKYACGLTQFTADTAKWVSDTYRVDVGPGDCLNAAWALRAQSAYMRYLETRAGTNAATACDRWRYVLWAYNGGLGWVQRDKALAAKLGKDPLVAANVVGVNAGRAPEFFKENRGYDVGIISRWQPLYLDWGTPTYC